MHSFALNSLT